MRSGARQNVTKYDDLAEFMSDEAFDRLFPVSDRSPRLYEERLVAPRGALLPSRGGRRL